MQLCQNTEDPSFLPWKGTQLIARRILIIEDTAPQRTLSRKILEKEGYQVVEAINGKQARKELATQSYDVALVDWELPDIKGLDLIREFSNEEEHFLPLIVLTGHKEPQYISQAFDDGAFDYLSKPASATELRARIRSALRFRDLQQKYLELAIRDPLTGLYNRRYFDEHASRDLDACMQTGKPFSMAIVDIDHFKKINDTHGHDIGDLVLQQMSRHLTSRIRIGHYVCRLGGEEFAIVFAGLDELQSATIMQRLLDDVRAGRWGRRKAWFKLTFSGGVATAGPHSQLPELCKAADEALYFAKENGRQQIKRYSTLANAAVS